MENHHVEPVTPRRNKGRSAVCFIPLENEIRTCIDTASAAHHLMRSPQTLRLWAAKQNGPLQPIKVTSRLMWAVADIKRVLEGA